MFWWENNQQLLSNYRFLLESFSKHTSLETRICYAMKANAHPGLLTALKDEGAWIDAVSPGEVKTALDVGFPGRRILFTGTSVSTQDLKQVFEQKDVIVTIDAHEQLELMKEVRDLQSSGLAIKVAIRWNPGVGRGFHPRVITAGKKSTDGTPIKFGIEEERVIPTFAKAVEYGFKPVGLHQHLGSGWVRQDFQDVMGVVDKMIEKASELQKAGFTVGFLDFGGGFGPQYSEEQEVFPVQDYVESICQRIAQSNLDIQAIAIEPGKHGKDYGCWQPLRNWRRLREGNSDACSQKRRYSRIAVRRCLLQEHGVPLQSERDPGRSHIIDSFLIL